MALTLLGIGCKLVGLAEWFDGRIKQHDVAKQSQNEANTPTTNQEWDDAAKTAISSCLLLLTACAEPTRPVAIKQFTRAEQLQIASEHDVCVNSAGSEPLFDQYGNRITFTMTPAVFDDWERMRANYGNSRPRAGTVPDRSNSFDCNTSIRFVNAAPSCRVLFSTATAA